MSWGESTPRLVHPRFIHHYAYNLFYYLSNCQDDIIYGLIPEKDAKLLRLSFPSSSLKLFSNTRSNLGTWLSTSRNSLPFPRTGILQLLSNYLKICFGSLEKPNKLLSKLSYGKLASVSEYPLPVAWEGCYALATRCGNKKVTLSGWQILHAYWYTCRSSLGCDDTPLTKFDLAWRKLVANSTQEG